MATGSVNEIVRTALGDSEIQQLDIMAEQPGMVTPPPPPTVGAKRKRSDDDDDDETPDAKAEEEEEGERRPARKKSKGSSAKADESGSGTEVETEADEEEEEEEADDNKKNRSMERTAVGRIKKMLGLWQPQMLRSSIRRMPKMWEDLQRQLQQQIIKDGHKQQAAYFIRKRLFTLRGESHWADSSRITPDKVKALAAVIMLLVDEYKSDKVVMAMVEEHVKDFVEKPTLRKLQMLPIHIRDKLRLFYVGDCHIIYELGQKITCPTDITPAELGAQIATWD